MVHLPPSTSPANEYEPFLSAPIAEQENGTPVSVLSALTRSNYDPWQEAARLAKLPPDRAQWALVGLLNELLGRSSGFAECEDLAKGLAQLLPAQELPRPSTARVKGSRDGARLLIFWLLWVGFVMGIALYKVQDYKSGAIERPQKETSQNLPIDSSKINAAPPIGANKAGLAGFSTHHLDLQ